MDPKELLKDELKNTLTDLGRNAKEAERQLDDYLTDIDPDISEALASGDTTSLKYIRDRMLAKAGRVSLGLIYRERTAVVQTVMTVIRLGIKLALA